MVQVEHGSQFGETPPTKEHSDSTLSFGVYIPNNHRPITNWLIEHTWQVLTRSGKLLTERDILQRTGVERRFWASKDETVVDMGFEAAKKALKGGQDVDFVMVSTSFPCGVNVASEIARRLNLPKIRPGIPGYVLDVHAACSGFVRGLAHLKEFEDYFRGKRILFVSTEKYSDRLVDLGRTKSVDVDPSLAQTIFSDGAVALDFTYGEGIEVLAAETHRFGIRDIIQMPVDDSSMVEPYIYEPVDKSPDYFRQNGGVVYEEVRNGVPPLVDGLVERAGIDPTQIQAVYPHQGSGHVLDALQRRIKHGFRLVRDIEDGNFSSASIPKALAKEAQESNIDPHKIILIAGFGAGAGLLASIAAIVIRGARERD